MKKYIDFLEKISDLVDRRSDDELELSRYLYYLIEIWSASNKASTEFLIALKKEITDQYNFLSRKYKIVTEQQTISKEYLIKNK